MIIEQDFEIMSERSAITLRKSLWQSRLAMFNILQLNLFNSDTNRRLFAKSELCRAYGGSLHTRKRAEHPNCEHVACSR